MPGLKAFGRGAMVVIILLFSLPSSLLAAGKNPEIKPDVVKISSFFSGVQMHITCDLPPDCQAVLSAQGKRIEEELMRKSHRWEL